MCMFCIAGARTHICTNTHTQECQKETRTGAYTYTYTFIYSLIHLLISERVCERERESVCVPFSQQRHCKRHCVSPSSLLTPDHITQRMRERAAHAQLLAQEEQMREAQARQRTRQKFSIVFYIVTFM